MALWTDEAKERAAAEDWELVDRVPGPYQCELSRGWVPENSHALRIRGTRSGMTLVVGRGVARKYFGIPSNRLDVLLAGLNQDQ